MKHKFFLTHGSDNNYGVGNEHANVFMRVGGKNKLWCLSNKLSRAYYQVYVFIIHAFLAALVLHRAARPSPHVRIKEIEVKTMKQRTMTMRWCLGTTHVVMAHDCSVGDHHARFGLELTYPGFVPRPWPVAWLSIQ